MKNLDQWLNEYAESHQTQWNKKIHWVCVPAIAFSVLYLLSLLPFFFEFMNWATVISALAVLYYFYLSPLLAILMMLFFLICFVFIFYSNQLFLTDRWIFPLIIFILAWIGQFIGHKIEGKKPSFFKDLQFLLIGPLWCMNFLVTFLKNQFHPSHK
jgi:uncharacterized membrane protein YGL010W